MCNIISKAQELIEVFLVLIGQKVFNVDRRTYFLKNSWSYIRLSVYAARQVSNAVHCIALPTSMSYRWLDREKVLSGLRHFLIVG